MNFMKNSVIISLLLLATNFSYAQVEVKSLNHRFMWVNVESKYVKARLNYPIDGNSICWIEVKTAKENFDFIFRRGLPYENCLERVLSIRKLLKKNDRVEIIGFSSAKDRAGRYHSLWEVIRAKSGCEGYFGDCKNFEKDNDDWSDPHKKIIDPKMYP